MIIVTTTLFAIIEVAIAAILTVFGATIDITFFFIALLAVPYCFVTIDEILSKYRRRNRWRKRHQRRATTRTAA